jgi:hypothetical protein
MPHQGYNSEDIAAGIDEMMIRQPLGVCAIIAPFNFPSMIPFWFLPYAVACGNTVVIKPSERVPLTMQKVMRLIDAIGLPPGVLNLVNGGRDVVNAILDHPTIRSVSFVGSTTVAKHVYARAAAAGKRAQCQGGAKNPAIVLPDADLSSASDVIADSAFGCAGQRCLAAPGGDGWKRSTASPGHRPGRRRASGRYGRRTGWTWARSSPAKQVAHRDLDRRGAQEARASGGRPRAVVPRYQQNASCARR